MKKGLRPTARDAGSDAMYGRERFPDEEGIKTLGRPGIRVAGGVARDSLMKKGLRQTEP